MSRTLLRPSPIYLIFRFLLSQLAVIRLRRFPSAMLALLALVCATASVKDPLVVQASTLPSRPTPPALAFAGGETSVDISVLSYNVKALPWPLRMDLPDPDTGAAMAKIGAHLAALQMNGTAPDVVLIQEGFASEAALIGQIGGYPYAAEGPTRADADGTAATAADTALAADAKWVLGEGQRPLLDSGLRAFSKYPITIRARRAFGRHACAGYDCLAAKGVLVFSVEIPGVPEPVTFLTLHMNANGASGAPEPRRQAAYRLQMDRLAETLQSAADSSAPLIFGGDFNVKTAAPRQQYADLKLAAAGLTSVHNSCARLGKACVKDYPADGSAHWLEPRDVQGFRDGTRIRVRPVASAEMFAGEGSGGQLSDHIGYFARYRLSWPTSP